MSSGRWTIAERLARTFFAGTIVLGLAIAVGGDWFLKHSVERELEALLAEEHEELDLVFDPGSFQLAEFEARALALAEHHPANPLAWRVWDADGSLLGEVGAPGMLGEIPRPQPTGRTMRERAGLRWRSERRADGLTIGLVLDGDAQLALLARYRVFASAAVLASTLLGLLVASFIARRVSGLLARVARSASAIRDAQGGVELEVPDAPEEIHQVVAALRTMSENVRRESAQSQVFVASLAHELRSPVQNLIGETEVALLSERDAPAYREVLASHLEELRELGDAIDNLVTLCSAGRARQSGARERFDLREEIEIRLRRSVGFAERHGVNLCFSARGDTLLTGDREAILRAVRNLVANAIQWSPPGSEVDVELEGENGRVVLTVDDAGSGVPPELAERVFEPFFRGPRPASGEGRVGYGLGLALARSAAENQGGVIEVGTSPAGGARFRLVLPRGTDEHDGALAH